MAMLTPDEYHALLRLAGVPQGIAKERFLMQPERRYWFPAKHYGWGWSLPNTWQGWLVLAALIGLIVAGAILFPPAASLAFYLAYIVVLIALLLGVCWLKGEPPRWRWGNDEQF
jgi:hypothetical protein